MKMRYLISATVIHRNNKMA